MLEGNCVNLETKHANKGERPSRYRMGMVGMVAGIVSALESVRSCVSRVARKIRRLYENILKGKH